MKSAWCFFEYLKSSKPDEATLSALFGIKIKSFSIYICPDFLYLLYSWSLIKEDTLIKAVR